MQLAAANSQALWYLTRGFGLATMILLTASVVLGITQFVRYARPGVPRFVVAGYHKNVSLLAIAFLAVHVATAVADPFAPIGVVDAVVPFVGKYRPLWLGLGAVAADVLIALGLSSLIRQHIGYRAWRAIHWSAYACWPVALVHGLGTGSDTKIGWVQVVYALCVLSVLAALGWRLLTKWSTAGYQTRIFAAAGALALTAVIAAWTAEGPLRSGWARRSGTPPSLLGGQIPASPSSK